MGVAPMGKTRHFPAQEFEISKIADLSKSLGMKSVEIVFCPVQNMFFQPQKTDAHEMLMNIMSVL